jgi:signal transduction histidine kinase
LPNADARRMQVHYTPDRGEDGRIKGILALMADVTAQKQSELALRQNHALLEEKREELQSLTDKLFTAQDTERQRIARDLHDDFSQRLVAAALDLEDLGRNPPLMPQSFGRALEPIREELAQLSDDLRELAHQLHPSLLKHAGLRAALEEHIHQAMKRTGLDITLKVRDVPDSLPLDVATSLFRVFQESLQNVAKHANATEVVVKLSGSSKGMGLSVTDNGTGFNHHDKSSHQKGLGLTSMRERLRLLNGFLNIHSRPADGTKVCAWIPSEEKKP